MMTGLAAGLLVFTGIWHLTEWMMGGRNKDTLRLIPFGAVYLTLGYLIAAGQGGALVLALAFVVTLIGMSAAFVLRAQMAVRPWVIWAFIVMDVVIVIGLGRGLLTLL